VQLRGRDRSRPAVRPSGEQALVYRGPASTPGCPEAVAAALARSRWGLEVRYVGPKERLQLGPEAFSRAVLYAQPGGGSLRRAWRKLDRHAPLVREFVRSGGGYLGFCLGGYLAGRTPGFGLLPGDTDRWIASPGAPVTHAGDAVTTVLWGGVRRKLYVQDAPWFDLDPDEGAADVLATYANGLPAAVSAPFGSGTVGVVGPHPEASADWFSDVGLDVPADLGADLTQDLIDRSMTRIRAADRSA
jgi:biotin protein ligase-like protein